MACPALLSDLLWFPPATSADREGLVAVGGDLSVDRLLLAYRGGLFPWTTNPLGWWSPNPRGVFELAAFHVPRTLQRTLRRNLFEVTFNRDFQSVIAACAAQPRGESTWITPAFIAAYQALHAAGHAHSVEVWRDGRLVGGVYGVAVGGLFAGESMFHVESDASKVAVFHLVQLLRERGFTLFDTQMVTPTTAALGAVEIPRAAYLRRLALASRLNCRFD
jgi:leucyl/phenylalanyl-tRNA--protein transferase